MFVVVGLDGDDSMRLLRGRRINVLQVEFTAKAVGMEGHDIKVKRFEGVSKLHFVAMEDFVLSFVCGCPISGLVCLFFEDCETRSMNSAEVRSFAIRFACATTSFNLKRGSR